jgi:hypothetical protein
MATVIIGAMVIFLQKKKRLRRVALNIIAVTLCMGIIALLAVFFTRRGIDGWASVIVIFFVIPVAYILNLTLFVAVFDDITDALEGKLIIWTAVTFVSASMFMYGFVFASLFDEGAVSNALIWLRRIIAIAAFTIPPFNAIAFPVMLFVKAQKFTKDKAKKRWIRIAFFVPIVGSVIYLCSGSTKGQL